MIKKVLKHQLFHNFVHNFFSQIFFLYIKMSREASARYYQKKQRKGSKKDKDKKFWLGRIFRWPRFWCPMLLSI